MSNIAVNIEHLSFRYQGQVSDTLSDINLKIEEGASVGLFGPNGAGKTTLLHLMTGILKNNEENITLFGKKVGAKYKETNNLFGLVPQDFSFYQELSPIENLHFSELFMDFLNNKLTNVQMSY